MADGPNNSFMLPPAVWIALAVSVAGAFAIHQHPFQDARPTDTPAPSIVTCPPTIKMWRHAFGKTRWRPSRRRASRTRARPARGTVSRLRRNTPSQVSTKKWPSTWQPVNPCW